MIFYALSLVVVAVLVALVAGKVDLEALAMLALEVVDLEVLVNLIWM